MHSSIIYKCVSLIKINQRWPSVPLGAIIRSFRRNDLIIAPDWVMMSVLPSVRQCIRLLTFSFYSLPVYLAVYYEISQISGHVTLEYDQRSKIWIIISPFIIESPDFKFHRIIWTDTFYMIVRLSFRDFQPCDPEMKSNEKYDSHNLMHFPKKYKCVFSRPEMTVTSTWAIILFRSAD